MSEKQRDAERDAGEAEEPETDDFEAHRHIDRDVERDDSSGMPNRDDAGRDID